MSKHECKLNFLSRSDGSAYYKIGDTAVLVSVHGPREAKAFNRLHDNLFLDIYYNSPTGLSNNLEKSLENILSLTIKQTLLSHLHPRTLVTITVQELQSDGLSFSASINASCLALLDAGIQMKTTFAAVTCCITRDSVCIVEPTQIELKDSTVITFVFEATQLKILATYQEGTVDSNIFSSSLLMCQEAAKDIFEFYRRTIDQRCQMIT